MNDFKIQKEKVFFLIFLSLFMVSLVSAAIDTHQVDDVFQINKPVQYLKPCINNASYCSAATSCNYTFFNPDGSILHNNVRGIAAGFNGSSVWGYNVSFTKIGIYQIDMTCIDQGNGGAATFYAQVTGTGFNDTAGFYILVIVLSLGVLIIGFFMSDPIIVLFGSFGLYFLGLYILFNGIVGVKDMTTTWALGIITLGIAGYTSIRAAYELVTD